VPITSDRAPITATALLPAAHASFPYLGQLGQRPDLLNMPPNQIHLYKPMAWERLARSARPRRACLEKDSWAAAVVDELKPLADDINGRQYGSAASDTRSTVLKNPASVRSVHRREHRSMRVLLADRRQLPRYGCIMSGLLRDDVAAFCTEATLWNVKKCYGSSPNPRT